MRLDETLPRNYIFSNTITTTFSRTFFCFCRRPSPRPTASPMSRLRTMSPAARRLASANLRLSTGSMFGTGGATPTSLRRTGTPQRAVTPKLDLGIRKPAADDNLTDDLLAIPVPVPKRQRAADFF